MKNLTPACLALIAICSNFMSARPTENKIKWTVSPDHSTYAVGQTIKLVYRILNNSGHAVWVLKAPDGISSIRFHIRAPNGTELEWSGASLTVGYQKEAFTELKPAEMTRGSFDIPNRCPDEKNYTKGGFCFRQKGTYRGRAEYLLGGNGIYDLSKLPSPIVEGPLVSNEFTFSIQ